MPKKIEDGMTAKERYDKANTRFVGCKFNRRTDKDILEWLDSQPSMLGAVKTAIRYYIANNR